MGFKEERGIAYCGMACVLCRYKDYSDCRGCAVNNDDPEDDCLIRKCARKNGIDGCFACHDYPCGKDLPKLLDKQNKAFLRFAREFGKQALIDRLRTNYNEGIIYQGPGAQPHGKSAGDYDILETEYEIYHLLRYGLKGAMSVGEIVIKPLSPELIADYFDFFNNRAFTDNPPWGGCYCTGFQMTKEDEKSQIWDRAETYGGGQENLMRALREVVIRQITSGALRGYLAYVDGVSIGWCNANDKTNLPTESASGFRVEATTGKKEKVVLCFEIAPEYRGKGIATALLNRVVADAIEEGYATVEGFPRLLSERDNWDFTGPVRLYEKAGFTPIKRQDGSIFMRNDLDS